ncbi:hypothetical protein PTSG_01029 [Salpingoeca rosetta]|uniref:Uncharacterized protein n=1 Tax=Salpingoeca rosetta (strain ATCC 50818 / BSB-021) TaxID=946362 RepID=F2TY68_SALR5|nr:uncharacterized protein PTSG_01029 [Salpingoeca rosetta]EGD76327.1 hypothetical protein PTSG_01029 [Salpingoeca rosetta]|eukprot:XP_004998502.1 hypothetical protein PTSG_01029 [Salpingoeca rosetta]
MSSSGSGEAAGVGMRGLRRWCGCVGLFVGLVAVVLFLLLRPSTRGLATDLRPSSGGSNTNARPLIINNHAPQLFTVAEGHEAQGKNLNSNEERAKAALQPTTSDGRTNDDAHRGKASVQATQKPPHSPSQAPHPPSGPQPPSWDGTREDAPQVQPLGPAASQQQEVTSTQQPGADAEPVPYQPSDSAVVRDVGPGCATSLQASACPADLYAPTTPEVCRPGEPTPVKVAECELNPIETLTHVEPAHLWYLHVPGNPTLIQPLVWSRTTSNDSDGAEGGPDQGNAPPASSLDTANTNNSNQGGQRDGGALQPLDDFRPWPAPAVVVLGFLASMSAADTASTQNTATAETRTSGAASSSGAPTTDYAATLPGLYFVDGRNGAVFNATHAFTNKRWHRVPSERAVQSALQPQELGGACVARTRGTKQPHTGEKGGGRSVHVHGLLVDLVIVWGETFQHTVLDVLPRLAAFLQWLKTDATTTTTTSGSSSQEDKGNVGVQQMHDSDGLREAVLSGKVQVTLLVCAGSDVLQEMLARIVDEPWAVVEADPRLTYTADAIVFPTLAGQQKIGIMPPGVFCPLLRQLQTSQQQRDEDTRRPGHTTQTPGSPNLANRDGNGDGAGEAVLLYLSRGDASPRALVPATEQALIEGLQQVVEAANMQGMQQGELKAKGGGVAVGAGARIKWRLEVWNHTAPHAWQRDAGVFRDARVIVGPHGGAFANLLFAGGSSASQAQGMQTHVLEFIPRAALERPPVGAKRKGDVRPCYLSLAQALGFSYHQVEPTSFDFNSPGLDVDVDVVINHVRTIISMAST